jgi:hypothetical protein
VIWSTRGWCLWLSFVPSCAEDADARLFLKGAGAFHQFLEDGGVDIAHGRGFYRLLLAHGLVDVQVDGNMQIWPGGSPGALLWRANIDQLRAQLVGGGLLSEREVERFCQLVKDPGFSVTPICSSPAGDSEPAKPRRDADTPPRPRGKRARRQLTPAGVCWPGLRPRPLPSPT